MANEERIPGAAVTVELPNLALERAVLNKLIGMFRPHEGGDFLDYPGTETICGPNDRAAIGFDTSFPKQSLIEDFDFTAEEAEWLIREVHARAEAEASPEALTHDQV